VIALYILAAILLAIIVLAIVVDHRRSSLPAAHDAPSVNPVEDAKVRAMSMNSGPQIY
jgi:hypothetical protein